MWLLDTNTKDKMNAALATGNVPTAADQDNYIAGLSSSGGSSLLSESEDTATINISGVLTKTPDLFAKLFGGGNVSYSEIIEAVEQAESNKNIAQIVLAIDSGGGEVDGLFDALASLQAVKKPMTAMVSNCCASAAYAIAAQADTIIAKNHAARIGSIGIAATFFTSEHLKSMRSTDAPKKNPNPDTDDGEQVIQSELDALHEIFVEAIASGRGVDEKTVNSYFGQGGVVLARAAEKLNMIDGILPDVKIAPATKQSTTTTGDTAMDLETLKAQHPAVFSAAVDIGRAQELERVTAHLTLAESYGANDVAFKAIKDGSGLTIGKQAEYLAAGRNKADITARADDNVSVDDGAGGGAPGDDTAADDKLASVNILKIAAEQSGIELEARHYE